jgi:CDP-glycerol glycerophosphotransferase (TagB/SpsB family)
VGHAGVSILRSRRADGDERQRLKREAGFPEAKRIILYGTQSVTDGTPNSLNSEDPSLARIKAQELQFLIQMARRHDFHIALKPHRNENADFYRELIASEMASESTGASPITLLPKETSAYSLLSFVDVAVTRWSTVGYEAMASGVPVFYLNFYPGLPQLACFEEPKLRVARAPEGSPALFDQFWKEAFTPEYSEWLQQWTRSQGWDPEAEQRLRAVVNQIL